MIYIFMAIPFLLVFFAIVSDNVTIGGLVGDVKKNAPTVLANYVGIMSIFGIMFATAFFNNAALRDHKYGFNEIMYSSPVSKASYYFGRFIGAWLLSSLVMLGIYLAFIIGPAIGPTFNWISPERVGPTPWAAIFSTYFIFVLPNMFIAGAVIFPLGMKFKSTIISFVGAIFIMMGYIISLNLMSDIDNQAIAAMVDIFGNSAYSLDTQYFTPLERNTISPSFTGHILKNRLIWMGVGIALILLSYFSFSFKLKTKTKKVKKSKEIKSLATLTSKPELTAVGQGTIWSDFWSFFKLNFISMFKSTTFIILIIFSIIMLIANLWGGFEYFGLKSYPVTYKMIDEIQNISSLFVLIVLVFFSGELVWRDRDHNINEVIDGTAHRSIISLVAKSFSLVLIASIMHLILMVMAIIYQTFNGYTDYELGVYLNSFLTQGVLKYLIWGFVMVFIQVIINQKYIAYGASILTLFVLDIILLIMKVETLMLQMGSTPNTMYSDMNGLGPGYKGHLWFLLYWILFAFLSLAVAGLFWPRGKNHKLMDRLRTGRKSLGRSYSMLIGGIAIAWLAVAAFVFYNTQVLNPYLTGEEQELSQVEYEKLYKQYQGADSPIVTDVVYHMDIYPKKRAVHASADVTMVNKGNTPISTLYFTLDQRVHAVNIPNSSISMDDRDLGFQIHELDSPLAPGAMLNVKTTYDYEAKGFENSVSNMGVLENGTFLNNMEILPSLGYTAQMEVSDKNKRRKYELPERDRMPDLETNCSSTCMKNYLSNGTSDWVDVETFISTSEDQIAIAPGSLVSEKVENGRRIFHYKVDAPSQNFYSFISARYEVKRTKWKDKDIEIYYHPAHEVNVDRMSRAVERSLEYYTENFGPYFHNQARIIEFPRYATFAQAFPGTMPYSEAIGFIINLEDETGNNVVDAVIAHEMAHQYWAHQVIGADMQGATMLSESFAEYSALMVMKKETPPLEMKDFVKYDLQRYLRGRSSEQDEEQALTKVENQGHIHYGKGSVILYALQEYIGEEKVNAALKGFLEEFRYEEPPYPNTHDFMRYLKPQVPDSLNYLIRDWFEEITLYDLRMTEASYKENASGGYDVSVDITALKNRAQPNGEVQDVRINDWVDVGFYSDRDEKHLIHKERIFMDKDELQFNFTLDSLPAKAAVDPLRLLIDRVYDDNRKTVELTDG